MIRKKVCMLGAVGVGKTSLVRQYVDSLFSDDYRTTVGVRVDKKLVELDAHSVTLMLWDVYGESERLPVLSAYLQGMDGYLLVVDASRPETLEDAARVHARVRDTVGVRPFALALNKIDLVGDPGAVEAATAALRADADVALATSAKTGRDVERCFTALAARLVGEGAPVAS